MFRFTRRVTTRNAAQVPAAIQFASEVCGYLNKTYDLKLSFGVEVFGRSRIYWQFETDSLDKVSAVNARMMQDRQYLGMLEQVKDLWVDGSLEDSIVTFPG